MVLLIHNVQAIKESCWLNAPLQAPYTPFITELMYQNLKTLIDPASVQEKNTESIHYLMLPQVR